MDFGVIGSRQNWHSSEVNPFNPLLRGEVDSVDSPHHLNVKITIGEVNGAGFGAFFSDMNWEQRFRGIREKIRFSGMLLPG